MSQLFGFPVNINIRKYIYEKRRAFNSKKIVNFNLSPPFLDGIF